MKPITAVAGSAAGRRGYVALALVGLAAALALLLPPGANVSQAQTAVTVEFEESTYTVAESDDSSTMDTTENAVEVKVTLSADPERTVTIPITKTDEGGATSSDYSGVPASVIFNSGDTEQTFTFTATSDTFDDDGETVKLGFGMLPASVTAGTTSETTVSITDDDDPVSVEFGDDEYSVEEGRSVSVTVTLSRDPAQSVTIPITATAQGGATSTDDYTDPASSVTFASGQTSKTLTLSVTEDAIADHGESILLSFGALPSRRGP